MEKPLYTKRRKRHDPDAKRQGIHGHTSRRRLTPSSSAPTLTRTEDTHNAAHRSFLLTNFELEGFDVRHSLDKAGAWDSVPRILAENCVAPPLTRRAGDGMLETSLSLAPVAVILPDPKAAASQHRLANQIFTVTDRGFGGRPGRKRRVPWKWRVRGLKLFAELPSAPPELIINARTETTALLPARLSCAAFGYRVPPSAKVRVNHPHGAFDVVTANGRPLDIDLGGNCALVGFSTQGRHPPTRLYPHVSCDQRDGWCVEGQPEWPSNKRYDGDKWTVLCSALDKPGHRDAAVWERWLRPQFVSRYELQWRAEHGRQWHSLGTFRGNSDATSEVAHLLDNSLVRGGITARYLRLIPLETVGGGAVRVGVYGHPLPSAARRGQKGPQQAQRPAAIAPPLVGEAGEDGEARPDVTYTLTTPSESRNGRFCHEGARDAMSNHKCRCSYCRPCHMPSRQRHVRREKAKEEIREFRLGQAWGE